ncbi:MAG: hypothetical protein SynsKO_37780 [Synoicihabitans sp.]
MIERLRAQSRRWAIFACLLPPLAAVVFVQLFASPLPLTDEWTYTHALREMHQIDNRAPGTEASWLSLYPTRHNDHLVILPFLIYAPLMEWLHYDSRWIIWLTLIAFAGQAMILRRFENESKWVLFPLVLLLFSPAHYMEFLWGWQITLTWSVLFPLLGLWLLSRNSDRASVRGHWRVPVLAVLCITLGTLSSAGGFLGFPAALIIVGLGPQTRREKITGCSLLLVSAVLIYITLMRSENTELSFGVREFWYICTALGAALWGSPVSLTEFGWSALSTGGLLIIIATSTLILRAIATGRLSELRGPLGVTAFGFMCVATIAMSRPYLGNWHAQYALPALSGAFLIGLRIRRGDPSLWAKVPATVITLTLLSTFWGYLSGFTKRGPEYHQYIENIEEFSRLVLVEPWRGRPYPPQHPERDMDIDLVLFLAAHDHPTFRLKTASLPQEPLPEFSHLWIDGKPHEFTTKIDSPSAGMLRVVVGFPPRDDAVALLGRIGSHKYLLYRIHPDHVPDIDAPPHTHFYAADIMGHDLNSEPALPEFTLLRRKSD